MSQPAIFAPVAPAAASLFFRLEPETDVGASLRALSSVWDDSIVVGLGLSTVSSLGGSVPGLKSFPVLEGSGFAVPSTPSSLWLFVRGADPGEVLLRSEGLQAAVAPAFSLEQRVSLFRYREGRDLTGYVDGTENPEGQRAREVALCGGEPGYAGGSFVAVQKWVHDLDLFATFDQRRKDLTFGRRLSDNEEIDDAPPTAHVKRTAQESFDPEAFILRRSMPFADEAERGLVFIAFGRSLDLYEALLRRMVGEEDGVADALFEFTRPVTGSYFWCPPTKDRQLDLSALGL